MSNTTPLKNDSERSNEYDVSEEEHNGLQGDIGSTQSDNFTSFPLLPDPEQENSVLLKNILSKTLRKVTDNATQLMKGTSFVSPTNEFRENSPEIMESELASSDLNLGIERNEQDGDTGTARSLETETKHETDDHMRPSTPSMYISEEVSKDDKSYMPAGQHEESGSIDHDTSSRLSVSSSTKPSSSVTRVNTDGKSLWIGRTVASPEPVLPTSIVSITSLTNKTEPANGEVVDAIEDIAASSTQNQSPEQDSGETTHQKTSQYTSTVFTNLPNDIELSDDSEGDSDTEHIDDSISGQRMDLRPSISKFKDSISEISGRMKTESTPSIYEYYSPIRNPSDDKLEPNISKRLLNNARTLISDNSSLDVPTLSSKNTKKKEKNKDPKNSENPLKNGGISKKYWMNDSFVSDCTNCFKRFTAFRRKHHCRFCGQIFCSDCTLFISYSQHKQERKNLKSSKVNTSDKLRVCKPCYSDVIVYLSASSSDSDSEYESENLSESNIEKNRSFSVNSKAESLNDSILSGNINFPRSPSVYSMSAQETSGSPTTTSMIKGVNLASFSNKSKQAPNLAIPATRKGEAVEIPAQRNNFYSGTASNLNMSCSPLEQNASSWFKKYNALMYPNGLLQSKQGTTPNSIYKPILHKHGSKLKITSPSTRNFYKSADFDLHNRNKNNDEAIGFDVDQDELESENEDEKVMSLYTSLNHLAATDSIGTLSPRSQVPLTIMNVPTLVEFPSMSSNGKFHMKGTSFDAPKSSLQMVGINGYQDSDLHNRHVPFIEDVPQGHNLRSHERAHASLLRMRNRRRTKPTRNVSLLSQNNSRLLNVEEENPNPKSIPSPVASPISQDSRRSYSSLTKGLISVSKNYSAPSVSNKGTDVSPQSLSDGAEPGLEKNEVSVSKHIGENIKTDMNLENENEGHSSEQLEMKKELNSQSFDSLYSLYLRGIIRQCLEDTEIKVNQEIWFSTLVKLLSEVGKLKLTDTIDVKQYVKIKKVIGGSIADSTIIDGMFITKNVDSKKMKTKIRNPKIALLMFPLEYLKQKEQFISLRIVYSQESVYIRNLVSRIIALKPDIIVVGDSVCRLAEQLLEDENITVISNTKPQVIERISRYTKANIFQSINDLFFKNGSLGTCQLFEVVKVKYNNMVKTFTYFRGGNIESGFTISLRGGDTNLLNNIKYTAESMISGVLNKKFEISFLENFSLAIPELKTRAEKFRKLEAEIANLIDEKNSMVDYNSIANNAVVSDSEIIDYVNSFAKRKIGESPIVEIDLPPALLDVIEGLRLVVSSYKKLKEVENSDSVEEMNEFWLDKSELKLDLTHLPKMTFQLHEILKIWTKFKLEGTIDDFLERSRIWSNSLKFPIYQLYPVFHKSIHFLHSIVSMKNATPCSGPSTVVINYYTDNDKCLGLFLDQLFSEASKICDECGESFFKHSYTYVHGSSKLDITLEQFSDILPETDVLNRNQRCMWSYCKICNTSTPIIPFSDDTYYLSIGKFIELCFYVHGMIIQGSSCHHDFFGSHIKFFALNNNVIKMEHASIDTYEVKVPKKQLEYSPVEDIKLKIELYASINSKVDNLFNSILRRLERINSKAFDSVEEIEKRISSFKDKLNAQRESISAKASEIYNSTPATVHISLNSVLRELQEISVSWDLDFHDFAKQYFPTENELTKLTQSHLKKYLMAHYNDETSDMNLSLKEKDGHSAIGESSKQFPVVDSSLKPDFADNEQIADESSDGKVGMPALKSNSVLDKVNKMEAIITESSLDNDTARPKINQDVGRPSAPVSQKRVSQLANFFDQMNLDQISKEFREEREKALKNQSNRFKTIPIAVSKPIVEIYNKIEDVVEVNDDSEKKDPDSLSEQITNEHPSASKVDLKRSNELESVKSKGEQRSIEKDAISKEKHLDLLQPEKTTLFKSLANFWADRSASLWEPLEYPLSFTEHTFIDSDVIVREDEPTSLIAFCLSSSDYFQKIKSMGSDNGDDPIDFNDPNNKKHKVFNKIEKKFKANHTMEPCNELERVMTKNRSNHLRYQYVDGDTTFSCKIFYSEQFETFRKACGNEKTFIQSLSRCVKWDSSGGKSGSNFLKTLDNRYIVKELSKSELESFVTMAPFYFKYISQSMFHTLTTAIAKIFGFYQIHIKNSITGKAIKTDLLIMENLFYNHSTTRIFDLKGSMRNRHVKQTGKKNEVLLDENMIEYIYESPVFVKEHSKKLLRASLFNDTSFLSAMDIMDYSLIIGIDDSSNRLYVGIIDWLRTFTWDKKVENWVKGNNLIGGSKRGKDPTVITPKQYRIRFREAMERYIVQVPDFWYEGT